MDMLKDILREGAIVLGLVAVVAGLGFGALRLRSALGGGIDDRMRMSRSQLIARLTRIGLAVTAVLWILIFVFMRDEYGANLDQALQGMMDVFAPSEPENAGSPGQ